MKLTIILVNYNGKNYNKACMESILASSGMEEVNIIVVDNASQDESVRMLEEQYAGDGRLELIRLDDNYGFSYANNVGIRRAGERGAEKRHGIPGLTRGMKGSMMRSARLILQRDAVCGFRWR